MHGTQLGSLVVGYELVVGCDNPTWDRGTDLRRSETTPGASAGGLVRATCLGKAIRGYLYLVDRGGGWGLVTIILAPRPFAPVLDS